MTLSINSIRLGELYKARIECYMLVYEVVLEFTMLVLHMHKSMVSAIDSVHYEPAMTPYFPPY